MKRSFTELLVIRWRCRGLQVQNKVFTSTAHATLFCSEPKIESWRWSRDVLNLQGMSRIRPPSLCTFSPAGFLPQRSSRADSAVATEGPAKRAACFILFYSAILTGLRVPKRGALCTGGIWSRGSAWGRRKHLVLEGARKKVSPPPLSARTFLRLCFAALSVKGNMRERPGKLDKAAQKRNGCFLYEAFSLSSRS